MSTFESSQHELTHGTNPVAAIITAIILAALMVSVTFMLFTKSSAYLTVKDIQNNKLSREDTGDYDTTSPVKAVDIQETIKTIEDQIKSLDNKRDYSHSSISEQSLGF